MCTLMGDSKGTQSQMGNHYSVWVYLLSHTVILTEAHRHAQMDTYVDVHAHSLLG